ncbi:MAG: DnaJ domain-containing protein, partial [Candidatus Fermentibacteria bacterium]|nr:DnaJ domain-containing protein [Candidatus Fermentibacteria bacterium]
MLDFYQRLNIKRNASQDDIETAYAKMALKHHPDVAGDSPKVQERFALINEAYAVLSKPLKRTEYDEKLSTPEVIRREEVITTDEGRGPTDTDSSQPSQSSSEAEHHTPQAESRARASSGLMSNKKLERIKHEARKLIKVGDFWRASALMSKAVIAYPRDIELRKLLSQAAAGRGRLREAVEELKKASEVEYFNPEI